MRKGGNKLIKKVIASILLTGVVLGVFFAAKNIMIMDSDNAEEKNMTWQAEKNEALGSNKIKVTENDRFTLYFSEDSGEISIEDKATKSVLLSNPVGIDEDPIAAGMNKMNMHSQLLVEYVDPQSNTYMVNNYTGSIKEGTYTYELKDNGIYITYAFGKTGFEIPVYYGLGKDYVKTQILCDKIKQHGTFKISAITFLPYMGSATADEEGYLVIPDGSGTLIHFNNQKQTYLNYSSVVYGRDKALNANSQTEVKEEITMPVFGIKKQSGAMLAVIDKGEYQAEIKAEVGGKSSVNNTVYSQVRFIQSERSTLLENSANEQEATMLSEQLMNFTYEVRYYLLEDKSAGYSEMALRYQKYLMEEKGMTSRMETKTNEVPMNIDLIGSVKKQATFLGIPYKTVEILTTYQQALDMTKELKEKGTSINLRYIGFMNNGLKDKLPADITYESKLGGKKDFKELLTFTQENGVGFYPSFDLINMYKNGNGFNSIFDSVRNVSRAASLQYSFLLSSGKKDNSISPWYLLKPEKLSEIADKLVKSLEKNGINTIGLEGISNAVYSDFKKDSVSRNDAGAFYVKALENIYQKKDSIMLDKAYAYAFPYTDVIGNVPTNSSGYDITDEDIPFYEIVMSGFAALYGEPVNMKSNTRDYLLKLVEYGAWPSYLFVSNNPTVLVNTDYSYLYGVEYEAWMEQLQETIAFFNPLKELFGKSILNHEKILDGVYRITYQDETKVYVNYNNYDVNTDNILVKALDYTVTGGE
ncbi:MAG: hypothetical protein K0R21_137 [Anaerocolumna sp.]|jgi:hypothetical protein|nr:hypothetical protein [Anaerocolumna sp.]